MLENFLIISTYEMEGDIFSTALSSKLGNNFVIILESADFCLNLEFHLILVSFYFEIYEVFEVQKAQFNSNLMHKKVIKIAG